MFPLLWIFLAILIVIEALNTVSIYFLFPAARNALYFPSKTAILGKKASGPRAAKTACMTSLVRVSHSKDGILKQWESGLDSSFDILQCLNAVSSYKVYWILCIFLQIETWLNPVTSHSVTDYGCLFILNVHFESVKNGISSYIH